MTDRISEGYTDALNAIAEAGREIARAVAAVTATPPWIDAQQAAEQPRDASGGNRTRGGLGERLRALGVGQTRSLRKELREIADEVDRLEGWSDAVRRGNTQCTAKSDHRRILGTDEFPIWSIRLTCDLPAGHDGEHHFPDLAVETPYHVEGS